LITLIKIIKKVCKIPYWVDPVLVVVSDEKITYLLWKLARVGRTNNRASYSVNRRERFDRLRSISISPPKLSPLSRSDREVFLPTELPSLYFFFPLQARPSIPD
jgi:hypothetical protein